MKNSTGTFIVIEGTDGSGKGTQFQLLADRLTEAGYEVATFDFPQYDQPSSYFVREYLNGHYGTAEEVGPYTGSLFYALDRFEAAGKIRQAVSEGKIVLANRFVGSNMAHQGTKFQHSEERRGYFIWLDNLEFEMLRVPRPDVSFVLRVPAEIAQSLVDQKSARSYTDKKRDLHEADLTHLQRAVSVYDDMCDLFPQDFVRVDCVRNNELLPVEAVQELLWQKISPLLPPPPQLEMSTPKIAAAHTKPAVEATIVDDPYVRRTGNHQYEITANGRAMLEQLVTSTDDNAYAFTNKLAPMTVAAALARVHEQGDELRVTVLEDFTPKPDSSTSGQKPLAAVDLTQTKRFTNVYIVMEQVSQLVKNAIEQDHATHQLDVTGYMADQKNPDYSYVVPEGLPTGTTEQYKAIVDQIFDQYTAIVRNLTGYIRQSAEQADTRDRAWRNATRAEAQALARNVLPLSTIASIGIHGSAEAVELLVIRLLSSPLHEVRQAGEQLLAAARKALPLLFTQTDLPEAGGAHIAYQAKTHAAMAGLAQTYLPGNLAAETQPIQLTDIWPRNEFDLVADMAYEYSSLPLTDIRADVATWPYTKKADIFESYFGERLSRTHIPGKALEKAHYSWDIISDVPTFQDMQRFASEDMSSQEHTPRYGYEVPKIIEDAGLSDAYENCFDLSLKLYSLLQSAGFAFEAQYATLLGHRMRWKITYNARQAFMIHESLSQAHIRSQTKQLVSAMHQKLAEVHPLLTEQMRFVGKPENPEFIQLGAQRYAQFKSQQPKVEAVETTPTSA